MKGRKYGGFWSILGELWEIYIIFFIHENFRNNLEMTGKVHEVRIAFAL